MLSVAGVFFEAAGGAVVAAVDAADHCDSAGSNQLDDAEWDALRIPIGLAFFVHNSQQGRMTALYPGPAGPTESLLALEAWDHIASRNAVLRELEPDVEALLVNRVGAAREYCLAPVDRCYELAGLIRMHWRGFSGGDEVWREIGGFFSRLREAGRA